MSIRQHDQLCFHQEREQQLIFGLQECSSALDRALHIILTMHGGDLNAIPLELLQVGQRYSIQGYTPLGPAAVPPLPVPYGYSSTIDVSTQGTMPYVGINRMSPAVPAQAAGVRLV